MTLGRQSGRWDYSGVLGDTEELSFVTAITGCVDVKKNFKQMCTEVYRGEMPPCLTCALKYPIT